MNNLVFSINLDALAAMRDMAIIAIGCCIAVPVIKEKITGLTTLVKERKSAKANAGLTKDAIFEKELLAKSAYMPLDPPPAFTDELMNFEEFQAAQVLNSIAGVVSNDSVEYVTESEELRREQTYGV